MWYLRQNGSRLIGQYLWLRHESDRPGRAASFGTFPNRLREALHCSPMDGLALRFERMSGRPFSPTHQITSGGPGL